MKKIYKSSNSNFQSRKISVVVQGDITKEIKNTLSSVRRFLPEAEIILSTWENSKVDNLDYDVLVLNKKPDGDKNDESYKINCELLSTKKGIEKANREYILKLRSNLILTSNKFLDYFYKFQRKNEKYNLFEYKVLTSSLYTRYDLMTNAHKKPILTPFHISHWWFFGLRNDVFSYFMGTELINDSDFGKYFSLEKNKNKKTPYKNFEAKFPIEQYIAINCFSRSFKDIYMADSSDYSESLAQKYRNCLVNNFIILEYNQSGICLNKYPRLSKNLRYAGYQYQGLYTFHRYEKEYKKLCDKDYEITTGNLYRNKNMACAYLSLYSHIYKSIDFSTPFFERLKNIFIYLPASYILYLYILLKYNFCKSK